MKYALFLMVLFVTACSSYQVTPTTNSAPGSRSGQVDVLYSTPQRPYHSVGIVSAKKYKPGWSDPTIADAIPQLKEAAAQVGADGVIVRGTVAGNQTRFITVEGEAIRYTDVTSNSSATVAAASAAKGFSSGRGCGAPSLLSENGGMTLYQAKCPSGSTLIIECRGESCIARN